MNRVRIPITAFMLVLLVIVTMGWQWTSAHQPPPQRLASHVVLGIAGLAGVFALCRLWWPSRPHPRRRLGNDA